MASAILIIGKDTLQWSAYTGAGSLAAVGDIDSADRNKFFDTHAELEVSPVAGVLTSHWD